MVTHLFPECLGDQIYHRSYLPKLSRILHIRPGAERQQCHAHHQVSQHCQGAQPDEARHPGHQVGHKHDCEKCSGCARCVEDVFSVVVLGEVCVGLVQLRLQLVLVALAELIAAHFLHGAEETHRMLAKLPMAALQVSWGDVWLIPTTDLTDTK